MRLLQAELGRTECVHSKLRNGEDVVPTEKKFKGDQASVD